eukprot:Skav221564  [mRNA]  locus=scaffold1376:398485:401075:- [translate_table: standard]
MSASPTEWWPQGEMAQSAEQDSPLPDAPAFESIPGYSRLQCNPCIFFSSAFGCKKADSCLFCHHHIQEQQDTSARPRRDRRRNMKVIIQKLLSQLDAETQQPQEVVHLLQLQAQRHSYARALCDVEIRRLYRAQVSEGRCQQEGFPKKALHGNPGSCGALHCFSV